METEKQKAKKDEETVDYDEDDTEDIDDFDNENLWE